MIPAMDILLASNMDYIRFMTLKGRAVLGLCKSTLSDVRMGRWFQSILLQNVIIIIDEAVCSYAASLFSNDSTSGIVGCDELSTLGTEIPPMVQEMRLSDAENRREGSKLARMISAEC